MNLSKIVYKIWQPGYAPDMFDPLLTLHGAQAMRFFGEVAPNSTMFGDKTFAIQAWQQGADGVWAMIATGVYMLHSGIVPEVRVHSESGAKMQGHNEPLISGMLNQAITSAERVLFPWQRQKEISSHEQTR